MKRIKRPLKLIIVGLLLMMTVGTSMTAYADKNDTDDVINEKFGLPIVVYGETLTADQKEEVKKLLRVTDPEMVEELTITAKDLARLIDGDPRSRMFSSAKITRKESGGLVIAQVTPENITQVTNEMYANALLTAGVEHAVVDVASPVKVTGHSALAGIYMAYEASGETLDKGRMEVANEELSLATELADKEGMDNEKISELLTEIKKAIADQNPATKEDIERIIAEQLEKLNIQLSEEDKQALVRLFEKMRSLDIDFDKVLTQLNSLSKDITNKVKDFLGDEDAVEEVTGFFKKIFQAISDFFKNLFGS